MRLPKPAVASVVAYLAKLLGLAAAYFAAAKLGLAYASIGQSVSLIWPPTGIAIAAILLLGNRVWPGICLGAFLANVTTPIPLGAAAGIAVGNTLEAVLAAHLFRRRAGPRPNLARPRSISALVFVAVPLGCLVSAIVGVTSLSLSGAISAAEAGSALGTWWVGDVLGGLLVAPLILTWAVNPDLTGAGRRLLEVTLLAVTSVLIAVLVLGRYREFSFLEYFDYPFLLFPLVFWAGLRFGLRGASSMSFTVAALAVWHTSQGVGPFAADNALRTVVTLLAHLGTLAVTGLMLAAVGAEREAAAEALRRSEERFKAFMDNSPAVAHMKNAEGRYLFVSAAFGRVFGRPTSELIGRTLDEIWPREVAAKLRANDRAVFQMGQLQEFTEVLPMGDGSVSHWLSSKFPLIQHGEEPILAGISVNISDLVRREEDVKTLNSALERKVGELTTINQELETFRYSISHDLRAPLRTLQGFTDLLLEDCGGELSAHGRAHVQRIASAARYLTRLTEDLLTYARLGPGEPVRLERTDLRATVDETLAALRAELDAQAASVEVDVPVALPLVAAQPSTLSLVLTNLVTNAAKFVAPGVLPCIRIRAEDGGSWVRLWVEDNGIGIDPRHQDRIFGLFSRLHSTAQYPGTGVGLAVVRRGIDRMGGRLGLDSDYGVGSRFWIELPSLGRDIGDLHEGHHD